MGAHSVNSTSMISKPRRRTLLLSVLLVLISQCFLQLHSVSHFADSDEDTCEICLTGRALEHAVAVDMQIACEGLDGNTEFTIPAVDVGFALSPAFQPRAPPLRMTSV